jgi:hypothetical protein
MSHRILPWLTPVAFAGMVVVNILANALPIGGMTTGALSALYPNLFVPAGFTFSIWGIIYLLLGLFSVCQLFRTPALEQTMRFVRPLFLVTCLANAGWIFTWHYRLIGLSVLVMLVLLVSLALIHRRLYRQPAPDRRTFWCVRVPFSVYLGWISVATIANITALLVHLQWDGLGLGAVFWYVTMLAAAVSLALLMLWRHRDFAFALVVLWALFGITARHASAAGTLAAPLALVPLGGGAVVLFTLGLLALKEMKDS